MNIRIISLDRGKDKDIKKIEARFVERLSKFCKIEFNDLKRSARYDSGDHAAVLQEEAATVLRKIKESDHVIVLDAKGTAMDSLEFTRALKQWQQQGVNAIVFVIGGPLGVAPSVIKRAALVLSLSRLTFAHEMARMLLCEALYRSFDIMHGGNYHK
jgi:23S rRNA (pseudouridine1915-N3)-methyltransferase